MSGSKTMFVVAREARRRVTEPRELSGSEKAIPSPALELQASLAELLVIRKPAAIRPSELAVPLSGVAVIFAICSAFWIELAKALTELF